MVDTIDGTSRLARIWLFILGAVIVLAGLFFAIGGGKLVSLGGSFYFLLAGLGLLLSGIQIIRRKRSGAQLFGLIVVLTLIWAIWDVGFDFWPLISRLLALGVGATVVALSYPLLRRAASLAPAYKSSFAVAAVLAIASGAGFGSMFVPHPTVAFTGTPKALTPVDPAKEQKNWEAYGNTTGASRFAALDQISRDNVKDLKVAWTYRTGDIPLSPTGGGAEDQQTPLQVGDRVFLCTPHNNVIAVDADTGKEIWKTEFNSKSTVWVRCRGMAYFDASRAIEQPKVPGSTPVTPVSVAAGAVCERRLIMNTIDAILIALDANTGAICTDFGTNGRVDLKLGLGNAPDPMYSLTSAPTLAGTTIAIGGRVSDNVQVDMPGGVIRGFDVITGQMRWAFDPRQPGNDASAA